MCVAVCCSLLQSVATRTLPYTTDEDEGEDKNVCCNLLQSVAVCCSLLQSIATRALPYTIDEDYGEDTDH